MGHCTVHRSIDLFIRYFSPSIPSQCNAYFPPPFIYSPASLSLTRSWSLLASNQGSRSSTLYPNLHSKVGVTQEINFPGILITLTCLSLFKFYNCSLSVFSGISFLDLFFVLVGVRVLGSHLETHLAVDFLLWSWLEA